MTAIKNIVFDLGNVILKDKPNIVLKSLNLDPKISQKINTTFFKDWNDLDLGKITIQDKYNQCNLDSFIDNNTKEYLLNYYQHRPFNKEILDLIKYLKRKNYQIFILSNNNIETKNYLLTLPLNHYIDGYIYSCDYQEVKPNPNLYKILFLKYSLIPEECFFIDDNKENIKMGELLGMKGYVFNNKKNKIHNLLKELGKVNILNEEEIQELIKNGSENNE